MKIAFEFDSESGDSRAFIPAGNPEQMRAGLDALARCSPEISALDEKLRTPASKKKA